MYPHVVQLSLREVRLSHQGKLCHSLTVRKVVDVTWSPSLCHSDFTSAQFYLVHISSLCAQIPTLVRTTKGTW